MKLQAMAKINLGLDVVRKRDDGYHEVRMIMQTIQMYDQLDMAESSRPGITACYEPGVSAEQREQPGLSGRQTC